MPERKSAAPRVNDFTLKFANVNGSGSASANALVMKAIFRMGVPVVGKNFFPSNIQGLPTWYEVRVTGEGWRARSGRIDLMVAMNAETYARDVREVAPGGWLLYDSTWPRAALHQRDDIRTFGVPYAQLCNEHFEGARARTLMKNIMYAGTVAALIDIDLEVIRGQLAETFAKKPKLVESNMKAIEIGYRYAKEHFECPLPIRVERMDRTRGHVMIDGNTAAALGCLYAGATVGAWYPITPSTSLMEEFIGLAYYAEVPAVIFDVQRVGPSTGMPTRTQQCDLLACAYASHGDTRHVMLFPDSPEESFRMAVLAFDLAERLQTPVFVLLDLDIGMNDWMSPEFQWDDAWRPDRGKVLTAGQVAGMEKFQRYLDPDGDGIPYRTLPGSSPKAAYFTRGSGHSKFGAYTEDSAEYQEVLDRLSRKSRTAAKLVPPAVVDGRGAATAIVSLGSCDAPVREALAILRKSGIAVDYMRVRGFPFGADVEEFLAAHQTIFVIEQNRDAQLRSLLTIETAVEKRKLRSILHYDGLSMTAEFVVDAVGKALAPGVAA